MKKLILLTMVVLSVNIVSAQWIQTNGPYGGYIISIAISGTNIFAGTDGGGVFFSSDNGANWTAVNNGLTNTNVHSLAISGTNIFAGTDGGGVWKRPLSELNGIKEISSNKHNIVIYPNPNKGKFTIAQTGNIKSIEIYNVMGEIVYKSRTSNTKIDISAQPKGIYFVKVDNGKKIHVEKFVLN